MAQKVLEVCTEDLKKVSPDLPLPLRMVCRALCLPRVQNEEELSRLERKINPALDDNACVAFSYFMETFINRMKCVPEVSHLVHSYEQHA